jgi:LacI family transcriptional regulator
MSVNLQDVAKSAGVSSATVSYVLNGRTDQVSKAMQTKVLATAQRLGYRPNLAARTVSTGRFFSVLMVHGTRKNTNWLSWETVTAAYDELAARGYHMGYARIPDEQLTDPEYAPKFLQQWMCDGLLLNYIASVPQRMDELIRGHCLPSIWINVKAETDCIRPDDFAAGAMIVQRLLELGHRRIAYADLWLHRSLQHGHQHYSKPDRLEGCRQAMAQAGRQLELWCDADWAPGREVSFIRDRLSRANRPTAVIGYSEREIRACQLAAAQVRLTLPADLSLATFGTPSLLPTDELHVSMAVLPDARIGTEAVRLLLERIENSGASQPTKVIPFEWQAGWSVALCSAPAARSRAKTRSEATCVQVKKVKTIKTKDRTER